MAVMMCEAGCEVVVGVVMTREPGLLGELCMIRRSIYLTGPVLVTCTRVPDVRRIPEHLYII